MAPKMKKKRNRISEILLYKGTKCLNAQANTEKIKLANEMFKPSWIVSWYSTTEGQILWLEAALIN